MGSFNAGGNDQGPDRRRVKRHVKRQGSPRLEWLEGRVLLATNALQGGNPLWKATSTNIADVSNGPMALMGGQLTSLYLKQQGGIHDTKTLSDAFPSLQISNGSVMVGLTTWGDFTSFRTTLTNLGMKVTSSSATYGLVNGWLPVNQLYTASQLPGLVSGRPIFRPETSAFQGAAHNQALESLKADVASTQYGVTGAGITVGALSDSFNALNGYAADVASGDLPANVRVVADLNPGVAGSDEGRAMLQNIYDIAPGAALQFATAQAPDGSGDDLAFANNIRALAAAGSKIIVDDIRYANEPMFQDGIIAQSVNAVVGQGIPYFSSAGNQSNNGYLSSFRGVNTTITGISATASRYMNFNGGGGTAVTQLPITTTAANSRIVFQFDQPFTTQQPVGSGNAVTSNIQIYILDASGNVVNTVADGGLNDTIATQEPFQFVNIPNAGSYTVAIRVVSGADPGHVQMVQWGNSDVTFSQAQGSAGGTYYPSSFGHATAVNTIGVGATPWWAPAPFLNQQPLASEPFSSTGPSIYVRDSNGKLLSQTVMPQNPAVTAPDGGNTTFFGDIIQTNNPPFPGQPATGTNLSQNLPSFFGTSSAAPNAAAVAALMMSRVPGLSVAQVKAGLIASASGMNGSGTGNWNARAGYGLINAVSAIAAVDVLTVSSATPANVVATTVPSYVEVTYSKPVQASTLSASDVRFVGLPAGVSVSVGAPIAVDNPQNPTIVRYPINIVRNSAVASTANGTYQYLVTGNVTSSDGSKLQQSGVIAFRLQDTTAPQVASTSTLGRQISVAFTKPMDASTITKNTILVARQNGSGTWSVVPSQDPRVTLTYNASTRTATLDFSAMPQTSLPSDRYAIIVISGPNGALDAVGNQLDGNFSGSFPSGDGVAGGNFLQDLGTLLVQAPVITSFSLDSSPTNDTGIASDSNTRQTRPTFIGQVYASFPNTVSNLNYYVQFNSLSGGNFNLSVGSGGRGFSGGFNVSGVTDANGSFTFTAPTALPEGFQRARVLVVGQSDNPPLPGYGSTLDRAFRVDLTSPTITGVAQQDQSPFPAGTNVSTLPGLSLYVQDPSLQAASYLATPSNVVFPALDPRTAVNLSNYQLQVVTADGTVLDVSNYITSAVYVTRPPTLDASGNFIAAYQGRIDLTFAPGLPAGTYRLRAFTRGTTEGVSHSGLLDAAGNALLNGGASAPNFSFAFRLQSSPAVITNMVMTDSANQFTYNTVGGPGSYYDLGAATSTTDARALAPPKAWMFDFSNPLPLYDSSGNKIDYSSKIELIRSADSAFSAPDGNFGDLGQDGKGSSGTGFTKITGTQVALYWQNPTTGVWTMANASHPQGTRLVMVDSAGLSVADYYRIYMPNQVDTAGNDTRFYDVYGNQVDGEFLGNPTSTINTQFRGYSSNPSLIYPGDRNIYNYETLLTTGYASPAPTSRMTGDGVAGGAFMTGFVVATTDHILYARPDYREDPFDSSTEPNGSLARPYSTLAAEGDPTFSPPNPTHDPNGGLNASSNFLSGFNPNYDRNGNGRFDRSALYAASQLAYSGPVVIVAIPGTPQRNPTTGVVTQEPFVLQAPSGPNAWNDASASIPFDTTLVFTPGTTLKSLNASLFVQNQGAALQIQGNSVNRVNFTSYNDASVGGPTNGNPNRTPRAGDWGGIVYRNYNQAAGTRATNVSFPVDGVLLAAPLTSTAAAQTAIAGADELMSRINFANILYGGGAVPRTSGTTYSAVTLYNSRPSVMNTNIAFTGGSGSTQAAIGADMDSFLDDDVARGPLIRRTAVASNSLNGIWMLAQGNGFIEATDATRLSDTNFSATPAHYALFQPLPLIVLAQLIVGQQYEVNSGGSTKFVNNRLYVDSGSMLRMGQNTSLSVINSEASLNVGSRDYITKYDADNNYGPESSNFKAESANDPQVLFTSIYDNNATTTLVRTPINVTGNTTPVTLVPAMWGGVGIQSGARAVINAATFQYGGGAINTADITMPTQSVLAFINYQTFFDVFSGFGALGTRVYVTNNNFYNNFDAAMQVEPDGLLAGDALRPLQSGHPFLRGNVMRGNGIDGLSVLANRSYLRNASSNYAVIGPLETNLSQSSSGNQSVDALWDLTDITYVVRGTIVLTGFQRPQPAAAFTTPPAPNASLTIQSALPGTLLADGTRIASPGASVVVKLLNEQNPVGAGTIDVNGSTGVGASVRGGAGFIAGVDDAVDPTGSPLPDAGVWTQIRILGIPGNQSTGQQRVPVVITSLRDTTVGTTARGVVNNQILNSYPVGGLIAGQSLTAPRAGDGGYIYIGANSATTYDLNDPRQGSLIDNADIRYMTRIEIQGGGIVDGIPTNPAPSVGQYLQMKSGYFFNQATGTYDPIYQLNTRMAVRISDSRLDSFADAGVYVHPTPANAIVNGVRGSFRGQGVTLYMYNSTISNTPIGVAAYSETGDNTAGQSPTMLVLVNNTFYNNSQFGVHTVSPTYNNQNSNSHVYSLLMNNIFSSIGGTAVQFDGMQWNSQLQYNLFNNNGANVVSNNASGGFGGNIGAKFGDPMFVDAANRNFALRAGSAAIDSGRSEIGQNPAGNAIYPTVTQTASGLIYGPRTNPATLTGAQQAGASGISGGNSFITDPRQIVTLPGSGLFSFNDLWVPSLTLPAGADPGPSYASGGFYYVPVSRASLGRRDLAGYIRNDAPGVTNTGTGANPFTDIGAYEYVNLNAPTVTAVTAIYAGAGGVYTTKNFYSVGGVSGSNQTPAYIQFNFNSPIDLASVNANSVKLQALGVTGNNVAGSFISLAGLITAGNVSNGYYVRVALGAAGISLKSDAYRFILFGDGSSVVTNTEGIALDGENLTNNNDPATGVQRPLPSGNGQPGGNFYTNFIINTVASTIVPGSFGLSPATDSNVVGDRVTNFTKPSFVGQIANANTALVPLNGQSVVLDVGVVALDGNGNATTYWNPSTAPANLAQFIRLNAGSALTNATGGFTVTVGTNGASIPYFPSTAGLLSSPYNVGSSGNLIPIPGTVGGYYVARVRVVDQSGNISDNTLPSSNSSFVVDDATPANGGTPLNIALTNPVNGAVVSNPSSNFTFEFYTSKNLDLTHLSTGQIQLVRAGADGTFANGTTITIDPSSISVTFLDSAAAGGGGGKGSERVTFRASSALTNGLYQLTILGTGANGVRDIAGNLPAAGDIVSTFAVYSPSSAHLVYVGAGYATDTTATQGTRANPFATISDAVASAAFGDRVAVLPGVYAETVTMRNQISVVSAGVTSTDSAMVAGNPLTTIIRPGAAANSVSVIAAGLFSYVDPTTGVALQTELAGFSIASSLLGDPALGAQNPGSVGLLVTDSSMLVDRNYFLNNGVGAVVNTTASGGGATPRIVNNGFIGNTTGLYLNDSGTTASTNVVNNTFAYNTFGLWAQNSTSTGTNQGYVANNIFWQNHDQTTSRAGYGIYSSTPNHLVLNNNLFSGNGKSDSLAWWAGVNVGNGFDVAKLGPNASDALANQGNYTGWPAFVSPIDPRPGSDGPAQFYLTANFGLQSTSAAINNALASIATTTDFLGNPQNVNPTNRGFRLPGYGPRDVGAFEFVPSGSTTPTTSSQTAKDTVAPAAAKTVVDPTVTSTSTTVATPTTTSNVVPTIPTVTVATPTPAPAASPTSVTVDKKTAARNAAAARAAAQAAARSARLAALAARNAAKTSTVATTAAVKRTPPRFASR